MASGNEQGDKIDKEGERTRGGVGYGTVHGQDEQADRGGIGAECASGPAVEEGS